MIERRFINPQTGSLDFTLPDSATYLTLGRDVLVSNIDTNNNVVVRTTGGQLINSVSSTVTIGPATAILFFPDGVGWRSLGLSIGAGVRAHLTNSAAQSVPSGSITQLAFDTTRYDTGGFVSGSTFVVPVTGVYLIGASIEFAPSAVGSLRAVYLRITGAIPVAIHTSPPSGGGFKTNLTTSAHYLIGAGVAVNCAAFQDSGAGLNVNASLVNSPEFWIQRMG